MERMMTLNQGMRFWCPAKCSNAMLMYPGIPVVIAKYLCLCIESCVYGSHGRVSILWLCMTLAEFTVAVIDNHRYNLQQNDVDCESLTGHCQVCSPSASTHIKSTHSRLRKLDFRSSRFHPSKMLRIVPGHVSMCCWLSLGNALCGHGGFGVGLDPTDSRDAPWTWNHFSSEPHCNWWRPKELPRGAVVQCEATGTDLARAGAGKQLLCHKFQRVMYSILSQALAMVGH